MTRIERSESQLNAEAVGKSESTTLDAMLADHRSMYAADIFIPRLSTESPPVFMDPHTGVQSADPMSRIGPTLSKQLAGYVDSHIVCHDKEPCGHDHSADPVVPTPSGIFPYARSMAVMRQRLCRQRHPEHTQREEWGGSLCYALVSLTVGQRYHYEQACLKLLVSPTRTEDVLRRALRFIEEHMDEMRARQTYAKVDGVWPAPPAHVHHAVPGLHRDECEQCRRAA